MTVKDHENGKIIILSKAFDTRAKVLNIFYAIIFIVAGIAFAVMSVVVMSSNIWLSIFMLGAFAVAIFAGHKFLNKSFQSEKLLVDKSNLTIIKSGLLRTTKNSYMTAFISNFIHLDNPEITKHPLAGQTFDYLGFQTEQAVINDMHGDNRLSFDYQGQTITFGENVYTWDFDELEILLYDITGNDFRYSDDFEKKYFTTDESQQAT